MIDNAMQARLDGQRRWREKIASGEIEAPWVKRRRIIDEERAALVTRAEQARSLQAELDKHDRHTILALKSIEITKKTLLTEKEIVNVAQNLDDYEGVYFLCCDGRVIYVGQSVNVHKRISEHRNEGRRIDKVAFIPTNGKKERDKIESLYIYLLRPELNGNGRDGNKFAPLKLYELIA